MSLRYAHRIVVEEDSAVESLSRQHFTGIKMILSEVAEQPERAARAGFLYYDMIVNLQKS